MRARKGQCPAERARVGADDPAGLAKAQHVVEPVVPALPGARLRPHAPGLEPPTRPPQPPDHGLIDTHPLDAVVPVADDEPEVALIAQDATPLAPEAHGQIPRVPLHRGPATARDQIRRRGDEDSNAPARNHVEAAAVRSIDAITAVGALVSGPAAPGALPDSPGSAD